MLSDYIPNPTFEVVAAPGTHGDLGIAPNNREGKKLRELTGKPAAPAKLPEWRPRAKGRHKVMNAAGHPRRAGLPDAGF